MLTVPKQEVHIGMEIDNASKEINNCSEQCELSKDSHQRKEAEPKIIVQNDQNLDVPGEVSIVFYHVLIYLVVIFLTQVITFQTFPWLLYIPHAS